MSFWKLYQQYYKRIYHEVLQYFEEMKKNKEQEYKVFIKTHQNTKVECECGGNYTNRNKQKHLKCAKHCAYVLRKQKKLM